MDDRTDVENMDRINSSALQTAVIQKKPLIPNKMKFFTGCLALALIELLFLTSSAFMAWIDAFLSNSGIDLSFKGIIPLILYALIFPIIYLFIYMVMYHMDNNRLRLDKLFPKNRTYIDYVSFVQTRTLKMVIYWTP